MTIKPLGDRIAVEIIPSSGMVGGIYVTDTTKSTRNQAFCEANVVGHGRDVERAKTGGKVVVSEYFGDEIDLEGRKLRVGRERDIVGVLENCRLFPVGDRVHVRKLAPPEPAKGEIIQPENAGAQQFRAHVMAVGNGVKCGLKPNDIVLVPKTVSVEVRLPGGLDVFHLVDEPALLAIIG